MEKRWRRLVAPLCLVFCSPGLPFLWCQVVCHLSLKRISHCLGPLLCLLCMFLVGCTAVAAGISSLALQSPCHPVFPQKSSFCEPHVTHMSVTIGVVCISVPPCFVFRGWVICWTKRFSQGISELNEPSSLEYSWLKAAKTHGRKICFVLSSRDQGFVCSPLIALHCSCHCPHPPGLHDDGQWVCFIIWGSALVPWERPCCTWQRMEEKLWLRPRTAFWSDQLCLGETQTQKSLLFSCVSYLSHPWDWMTDREEGLISIDGSGDTTFHHGRKGVVVSPAESMVVGVCSCHSHQTRSRQIGPEVRPRYDFQSPYLVAFLWKLVPHDLNVAHPPQIAAPGEAGAHGVVSHPNRNNNTYNFWIR